MRLIDADEIDFGKVFIGDSDFAKDTREAAQNLIDNQPTAYDVDKVVEQITDLTAETFKVVDDSAYIPATKVMDIVKEGGVNVN